MSVEMLKSRDFQVKRTNIEGSALAESYEVVSKVIGLPLRVQPRAQFVSTMPLFG